jgi:acetyl esterase/lipase
MQLTPGELIQQLLANQQNAVEQASVMHLRLAMETLSSTLPIAETVSVTESRVAGIPGLKLTPTEQRSPWHLMYFHGGGYVSGSALTHKGLTSQLAAACDAITWSVDYRLAPEAPFPAAIDDATSAYTSLLESGVDPQRILFAGDSAGGGLCVSASLKARELHLPLPAGLILMSPWLDLTASGSSYQTGAVLDPIVNADSLRMTKAAYLGDADERHPLASPIFADLTGLPPMLIQVGTRERLLSDAITLAEKVGLKNGEVTLELCPNMVHVFHAYYPFLPEARHAIQRIGEWVQALHHSQNASMPRSR